MSDIDQQEAVYWLTNSPTIAELRRLNRETFYTFPLAMLSALLGAQVDLEALESAVVKQVPHITDELVDLQYFVIHDGQVKYAMRHSSDGYQVLRNRNDQAPRTLAERVAGEGTK